MGSKFAWSIIRGNNSMCRDLWRPSETYVFPIFHMENVYIQYNSPIPILLPVSMNHLAERGQMLEARVLAFSGQIQLPSICQPFTDKFVSHRLAGHWRVAFETTSKMPRSIPFRHSARPFHHREVNKWRSMGRCLSSSSWYKQSHQYPRCQWWMNGHCRKTSNHEPLIQLLLLRAVCPIISCYLVEYHTVWHHPSLFSDLDLSLCWSFIRSGGKKTT